MLRYTQELTNVVRTIFFEIVVKVLEFVDFFMIYFINSATFTLSFYDFYD